MRTHIRQHIARMQKVDFVVGMIFQELPHRIQRFYPPAVTNLAIEVLPVYKEADRETYLTNLSCSAGRCGPVQPSCSKL